VGRRAAACLAAAIAIAGCDHVEPTQICPAHEETVKNHGMIGGYEGLDLLIAVDNSGSMAEEQQILAGAVIDLINALVDPPVGWPYASADDVRVAVVSSDVGLDPAPAWYDFPSCSGHGDDGQFQIYGPGKTVVLDAGVVDCPALDGAWAATEEDQANPALALQTACLTALGTAGCGFEQQLKSTERGLARDDQSGFIRFDSLLAVLVISDEEDCSVESEQLFAEEEIQDPSAGEVNLACGRHPEHLFEPAFFRERLIEIKGNDGVAFAAIVGVPPGDGDGPGACEGSGHELGECLDLPGMQLVEVQEGAQDAWFYRPACERYEGDELVTKARPGRRFVELAEEFGSLGYVYSICNEDWSPAVEDFAKLIAENLCGDCFPKPLPWDPLTHTATCDVWVEYVDEPACPDGLAPAALETFVDAADQAHVLRACELPKIPTSLECSDAIGSGACQAGVGWYYCENMLVEDFNEACEDALDNDGDGRVDCEDDQCQACTVCGGNGVGCEKRCKYDVRLTEEARMLVWGHGLNIVCPMLSTPDDPNCQERSTAACNDGTDNNGNGVWDCDTVLAGEERHDADFDCCPMHVDGENNCVIEPEAFEICEMTAAEPSDACAAHAMLLQCVPSWS